MSPGSRSSVEEVRTALLRILAQTQHLTARGRTSFLAEGLDGDLLRLAGERLIITVQSALDDLPEGFVATNADLPFHLVRGMRNRLAHGYDDVDALMVWTTLEGRLPAFIETVIQRLPVEGDPST